jgi:hypothetical protein
MNLTVLVETATGAQILPPVDDERAVRGAWVAHLAANADMRTKFPLYRKLAAEFSVVAR